MTSLSLDGSLPMKRRPDARLAAPRMQPLRAFRAFRRLVADKEDTRQVFEIMSALSGRSSSRGYARLLKTAEGGRQAYLGIELADRLQDRDWLASLPKGSVGAQYLTFISERDLSAYGLADESRKVSDVDVDAAHPTVWYTRRIRDVHDLWHVLTGYRTDALGEACVVSFSVSQTGNAGFGLIAGGAAVEFTRRRLGFPFAQAIFQAWRHGRSAAWLPAQDYEALLAEPLGSARKRLKIRQPSIYLGIPPAACDAYEGVNP
ncbi:MAG: Coq4 family protein [Cypionkella sp.]